MSIKKSMKRLTSAGRCGIIHVYVHVKAYVIFTVKYAAEHTQRIYKGGQSYYEADDI